MVWLRRAWLPILTHVGALLPLGRLIWNFYGDVLPCLIYGWSELITQ